MATEPETLIPLVRFPKVEKVRDSQWAMPWAGGRGVKGCTQQGLEWLAGWGASGQVRTMPLCLQVVLLGDHRQLRPVVKDKLLQGLGMDRSLFERYHRDACLLDTQYRMHQAICTFPSLEFYGGKLRAWQGLRRPDSILGHAGKESCSVIFGYVQGQEQSLLVSTDEGNENSKANLEEVAEVVSIRERPSLVPPWVRSGRASWRRRKNEGRLPGGGVGVKKGFLEEGKEELGSGRTS